MRILPLAGLFVLAGVRVVSAQPPEEPGRVEARRALEEGARRFESGDYAGALAQFEEAYRHFPSPRFFYNIGQAQRHLARDVEALGSFERFLSEAPDAPATTRQGAERSVAELRARVGTLEVSANVAGAEVTVDGHSFGDNGEAPIRLAPGPHQLVVQKAGYEPFLDRFEVELGGHVRVHAQLAPRAAPSAPVEARATVTAAAPVAPAPPGGAPLGHGGQVGIFCRADIAPTLPGFVVAPGLSYGLHDRLEVQVAALLGHYKGAWAGGTAFLSDGAWKPALNAGVPFFFTDGVSTWGIQGGAGLHWDPARGFGLFADVGAAVYPSAADTLGRVWLLSSVGVQGRY
jgi:hypothetical protein